MQKRGLTNSPPDGGLDPSAHCTQHALGTADRVFTKSGLNFQPQRPRGTQQVLEMLQHGATGSEHRLCSQPEPASGVNQPTFQVGPTVGVDVKDLCPQRPHG